LQRKLRWMGVLCNLQANGAFFFHLLPIYCYAVLSVPVPNG
jgi:hypothetical protein